MRSALVVLVALAAFAPSPAHADPAAEALFLEGRELMATGDVAAACDRFARSQALEAKGGTLLNLGDCREKQGQVADAWAAFSDAKAIAIRENNTVVGDEATRRIELLLPKLAYLQVKVSAVPGLAITRNGAPVAPATWDLSVPVDPGPQVLAAEAPGYRPFSLTVDVAVGAKGVAEIPALEVDPDAPKPVVPGAPFVVTPPLKTLGFGLAFGGTSDSDIIGGARVVAGYPVPRGAIRGTLQGLYTQWTDDADRYHHFKLYAIGIGIDYMLAWGNGLASQLGLGVGIDILDNNYDVVSNSRWTAIRFSPVVVRLRSPSLEIGLHAMYVMPAEVLLGVIAVDWYAF